jgi:hypothetical protein
MDWWVIPILPIAYLIGWFLGRLIMDLFDR